MTSGSKKKTIFLISLIVVLIAGLSGGWYWAAGKLGETVRNFSQTLSKEGKTLECDDQDVVGYPFRIGLRCKNLSFSDPDSGISVNGGALRSAAQLYRPGHVVAEFDAPYDINLPGLAPLTLDWSNLRTSSRLNMQGMQRVSLQVSNLDISANDFGQRDLLANLSDLQMHARAGENDPRSLDVALSAQDWKIDDNGSGQIEPVRFNFVGNLEGGHAALVSGADLFSLLRSRGGNGTVSDLTLATQSGGRVSVSGPVEIDTQGRLSGKITINLDEPAKLISYVTSVFPPAEPTLGGIGKYLEALAKKEDGKAIVRDLTLSIDKGRVFAGFLEIGQIPPLFQ